MYRQTACVGLRTYTRLIHHSRRPTSILLSFQTKHVCRKHLTVLQKHYSSFHVSACCQSKIPNHQPKSYTDATILLENFAQNIGEIEQSPNVIVTTLLQFVDLEYERSMQKYQWLQPINIVAKLQLEIMDKDKEMMEAHLESDHYKLLMSKVEEHYQSFSDLELIHCFEAMMLLFNELTSPVMTKLLTEITERTGQFGMRPLADFGACIRHLPKGILITCLNPIWRRFCELQPSVERSVTQEDLYSFANMVRNLHRYSSAEFRLSCTKKLLTMCQEVFQEPSSPEVINAVSYVARRLYVAEGSVHMDLDDINKLSLEVMKCAKAAAIEVVDKYDPRHIAEMCSSLKITNEYSPKTADVFITRSMELLSPELRLADVANLFYSLNLNISPQTKRAFESVLYPKLTEVDPITLANLTEAYLRISIDNSDVILRFQQLIAENIEFISQAQAKIFFILKFLSKIPRMEENVKMVTFKSLQASMKSNQPVVPFHSPTVANFCLDCVSGRVPEFLFSEVLRSIKHWRIHSLKAALINLSNNRQIYQPQLQVLVTEIQNQIYRLVEDTPQVIQNIGQLTHLIHLMALHAYYRDRALTDTLMALYLSFRDDLDEGTLPQVTKLISVLKYHSPALLDMLTSVVLSADGRYPLSVWLCVLEACALVGYAPRGMDTFVDRLLERLDTAARDEEGQSSPQKDGAIVQELQAMRHLTMLQYFPEDRLAHIFSLDFIEKVDDFLSIHPQSQQTVESSMMVLNRAVVLECPQLDVPWFHEGYCKKHVSTDECVGNFKHEILRESVNTCLLEALGGDEYLRTRTFSPYYYVIDFECLLDENNRPVSYSSADYTRGQDYQRVAVIPFTNDYCYNTQRLVNSQRGRLRHLQMLGYKVIQIPYFLWYSMGLAEQESKVNLLKQRIFS